MSHVSVICSLPLVSRSNAARANKTARERQMRNITTCVCVCMLGMCAMKLSDALIVFSSETHDNEAIHLSYGIMMQQCTRKTHIAEIMLDRTMFTGINEIDFQRGFC